MKKEEIKKALEYCRGGDYGCEKCPYHMEFKCNDILCNDTLTLITEQEKEIERLKAESANRLKAIEDFTAKKCYLKCDIAKTLVKEFAEQLKQKFNGYEAYYYNGEEEGFHDLDEEIDELLKTYGLDGKINGINLRLGITQKDFEIITTALREYAKNHPNPKCHANEAKDLAYLIEYQRQEGEE